MFYTPRVPAVALPPGETVVWTQAAPAGLRFRTIDLLLAPFSILWGGFAIFWEASAITATGGGPFSLFGIPFVLFGLYFIFGRFFVDAYLRSNTTYTVTDRAAYIARAGMFPAIRRYAGSTLDSIQFEPHTNGTGSIRFASSAGWFSLFARPGGGMGLWNGAPLDAFQDIPDAQRVYNLLVASRS